MALPARTIEIDHNQFYSTSEFMTLTLDPGKRYELVRGVIKEMSHPGGRHNLISDNLYGALRDFVKPRKLGRVLPPGAFELKIDPLRDTVRAPDLAFIPADRVGTLEDDGAIKVVPELAVEIYSPNDEPGKLREKLADYQQAGWNLVWVIYPTTDSPKRKAATVYIYHLQEETRLQPARTLGLTDMLTGEETRTGFMMPVADLFEL